MHVTIIATGKHWFLDAPAGWIALGLAVLIEAGRRRWRGAVVRERTSRSGAVLGGGD
jgi:hypothetical protein